MSLQSSGRHGKAARDFVPSIGCKGHGFSSQEQLRGGCARLCNSGVVCSSERLKTSDGIVEFGGLITLDARAGCIQSCAVLR
jgi:hypothetical protein